MGHPEEQWIVDSEDLSSIHSCATNKLSIVLDKEPVERAVFDDLPQTTT
jgi:hypothetical protein